MNNMTISHQLNRSSHQMKKFLIEHEHKILSKKEDKNQKKKTTQTTAKQDGRVTVNL